MTARVDLELTRDVLTDANYWHRRFFRCWVDGSYHDAERYEWNRAYVREHWNSPKRLRAMAVSEWCGFLASEFDCSVSTVRRHCVAFFSDDDLNALNDALVDDLRDLVRDEFEAA